MSDTELIDWEQLEMIFGEEEDEFDEDMAELFHEFVEDGNERFAAIQGAEFLAHKDYIAKESHKLKGSASNFGFARVASLLGHIEDDITTLSLADYKQSLEAALSGFNQSIETVVARYPGLTGGPN